MKTKQKKTFRQKIEVFFPRNQKRQKKGLRRNLGLHSAEFVDLFVLAGSCSYHPPALKSRRVDV